MKFPRRLVMEIALFCFMLVVSCEIYHDYFVINQCYWPILKPDNEDFNIEMTKDEPLKVLVIADIHLAGPNKKGFWVNEAYREWTMSKMFHSLISRMQPEIIFILGDFMDEGLYMNREDFEEYVRKFHFLFAIPAETKLYVVVGNHDIGFHDEISRDKNEMFINAFKSPSIQLIAERGNNFVLVNSMAMEGDNCFLCKPAMEKLSEIEKTLKCDKGNFDGDCDDIDKRTKFHNYSRPVLIQHFPLYRLSDIECNDFDSAPLPTKEEEEIFEEGKECLSKNATFQLLRQIEPRLSLSGHTHHGCTRKLPFGNGEEINIPSFNWRHKDNPSFGLGIFTPNNYAFIRCPLPKQSTHYILYATGLTLTLLWGLYRMSKTRNRNKFKKLIEALHATFLTSPHETEKIRNPYIKMEEV